MGVQSLLDRAHARATRRFQWIAAHLYVRLKKMNIATKFEPIYRKLLWWCVAVQFSLFILGSLTLDCGETIWSFLYAAVAFWSVAVIVILRRPVCPTKWDIYFFRYGLLILSFACWFAVPVIWKVRKLY